MGIVLKLVSLKNNANREEYALLPGALKFWRWVLEQKGKLFALEDNSHLFVEIHWDN